MNDLINSIVNEHYVDANRQFETIMEEIMEAKMYEVKRSLDLCEEDKPLYGTKEMPTDKYWAQYRKEHPSYGFYDGPSGKGRPTRKLHKDQDKFAYTRYGLAQRKKVGIKAHDFKLGIDFIKGVSQHFKNEVEKMNVQNTAAEKLAKKAASEKRKRRKLDEVHINPELRDAARKRMEKKDAEAQKYADSVKQRTGPELNAIKQNKDKWHELVKLKMSQSGAESKAKKAANSDDWLKNNMSKLSMSQAATIGAKRIHRSLKKYVTNKVNDIRNAPSNLATAAKSALTNPMDTARSVKKTTSKVARGTLNLGMGALGVYNNVMSSAFSEEHINENIGFAKKPKRLVVRRKRPLKPRKNKYPVKKSSNQKTTEFNNETNN